MDTVEVTGEERKLNVGYSQGTENDWWAGDVDGAERKPASSMDYRNNWWGRAENQGTTGACVGFAVGTVLHWHFVKSGKIPTYSTRHKPSYRYIWMASKETDKFNWYPTTMLDSAGTYLKSALDVARKFGVVKQKVFDMRDGTVNMPETKFNALASKLKIASYHAVTMHTTGYGFMGLDYWLSHEGPVVTRLDVDRSFAEANRRTPILDNYGGGRYGGHAIVIAGFRSTTRGKEYLVKNSWGRRWGSDRGFQWVTEQYAKLAFTESYGVRV